MEKIRIRPSSVDTFFNCPYQWYQVFLCGKTTIPGARAAIGTAIHSAVETMWTEAILTKKADANLSMMNDAAIESFQEMDAQDLQYDNDENYDTAEATIIAGVDTYVRDIVPYVDIPIAVEKRFTIELDHPVVADISGTVDYISHNCLDDVKTSKRKPVPASHSTQQSIYKMLAEANGYKTEFSRIQGVVLKKSPEGHVLELIPDVPRAKRLINSLLDVLEVYYKDMVSPEVLFRGNPKYYLCSPKYCTLHGNGCQYA